MAGINAHLKINEKEPLILSRDQAYIGVLIDDLITKGTEEPYRMFTSRAEYRTLLRQDNADIRLTKKAYEIGLASKERFKRVCEKEEKSNAFKLFYSKTSYDLDEINPILESSGYKKVNQKDKLAKVYSRPNITGKQIRTLTNVSEYIKTNEIDNEVFEQTEIQIKYQGYIDKEKDNAEKLLRLENIKIPKRFNYDELSSLSFEAKEKLNQVRPATLSQASRISGIKPSDISVLLVKMGR